MPAIHKNIFPNCTQCPAHQSSLCLGFGVGMLLYKKCFILFKENLQQGSHTCQASCKQHGSTRVQIFCWSFIFWTLCDGSRRIVSTTELNLGYMEIVPQMLFQNINSQTYWTPIQPKSAWVEIWHLSLKRFKTPAREAGRLSSLSLSLFSSKSNLPVLL